MACVFCDIAAGEAPAEILARNDTTLVFVPLNPVVAGHVLIVPKTHVAHAAEWPGVTGETYADAARWAHAMREPFNLITSAGAAATQTIEHLHVHYVPRHEGDGLHLPWSVR